MACCKGPKDPVTQNIDKLIREEKQSPKTKKILLLGTGDAGKSTFIKQMKIHYQDGFTPEEREKFAIILRENTLQAIHAIISACEEYGIKISEKFSEDIALVQSASGLTKEVARVIKNLWKSCEGIRTCFEEHEHKLNIPSGKNAVYFFQNASKFAEKDFVPDNDDIVRARSMTTGIQENLIQGKSKTPDKPPKQKFRLIDIGGQRSERRKWISCFDDCDAVIYLSAINEYDMTLIEASNVNRLEESLNLFRNITKGKWFQNIPWIVFLNKSDLFKEKIQKSPLRFHFKDYDTFLADEKKLENYNLQENTSDIKCGLAFLEDLFRTHYSGKSEVFVFETNALDTEACISVWKSLKTHCFYEQLDNYLGFQDGSSI